MRILNRILIVLIVLLTIGSAVIGILLYQNRNLMRDRADIMAETLVEMVSNLDREGQTAVGDDVTFEHRNTETGEPDSGTLSWSNYLKERPDFSTIYDATNKSKELTDQINTQRNHLAEKIGESSEILGMDKEDFVQNLKNADTETYERETRALIRLAEATNNRTEDMVEALENIADIVDTSINNNMLFAREQFRDEYGDSVKGEFQHQEELINVVNKVDFIKKATINYQDSLVEAIEEIDEHDWSVMPHELRNMDNYQAALTKISNDFTEINQGLIRSRERQATIKEKEKDIDNLEVTIGRLNQKKNELTKKIEDLREWEKKVRANPGILLAEEVEKPNAWFPEDGKGKVLDVSQEYGFIIINLGTTDRVAKGLQLLVNRDGKFIARIEVTETREQSSVAEVVPDLMIEEIKPGDQVISP